MSPWRELLRALRVTAFLWVLTAVLYPFLMLIFGQLILPFQANGSLIKNTNGEIIASALIGQPFSSEQYFWSRPSDIHYSTGENAGQTGISGASNLAPSNPALIQRIQERIKVLEQAGISPTGDLVYTSGSGLDPHISVTAAKNQMARIAKARNLPINQIEILINQATEGRFLGIFGEPGVNVVKLNLSLDNPA